MLVRLAKASDLASIAACEDLAFNSPPHRTTKKDVSPDGELASQIRAGSIHVIADAGKVLGYISLMTVSDHVFVSTIAVLPKHHRNGFGRQLLKFAENEAFRLGLHHVSLFTDGNLKGNLIFYRRNGYEETGRCDENSFSRVFFRKIIRFRTEREIQLLCTN